MLVAAGAVSVLASQTKAPATTTLREFLPLAHATYFGDAELVLANFGPEPVTVHPSWLANGRESIEAPSDARLMGATEIVSLSRGIRSTHSW